MNHKLSRYMFPTLLFCTRGFLIACAITLIVTSTRATSAQSPTLTTLLSYDSQGYRYQQGISFPDGYQNPGFDDSGWSVGNAGFGFVAVCNQLTTHTITKWDLNTHLVVRKTFEMPSGTANAQVWLALDNDAEVFINGHSIGSTITDGCGDYDKVVMNIPQELLLAGTNLLVVHAVDRGGDDFLDMKVTALVASTATPTPTSTGTDTPTAMPTATTSTPPKPIIVMVNGIQNLTVDRFECTKTPVVYDPNVNNNIQTDMARWFYDTGYKVYLVQTTTGPLHTATLEENADCVGSQLAVIDTNEPNRQKVVVAHSMGGINTLLYTDKPGNSTHSVTDIIMLGSPLKGIPGSGIQTVCYLASNAVATKNLIDDQRIVNAMCDTRQGGQDGLRQMEEGVTQLRSLSRNPGIRYWLIVGDANSFWTGVWRNFVSDQKNDATIPTYASLNFSGVEVFSTSDVHAQPLGSSAYQGTDSGRKSNSWYVIQDILAGNKKGAAYLNAHTLAQEILSQPPSDTRPAVEKQFSNAALAVGQTFEQSIEMAKDKAQFVIYSTYVGGGMVFGLIKPDGNFIPIFFDGPPLRASPSANRINTSDQISTTVEPDGAIAISINSQMTGDWKLQVTNTSTTTQHLSVMAFADTDEIAKLTVPTIAVMAETNVRLELTLVNSAIKQNTYYSMTVTSPSNNIVTFTGQGDAYLDFVPHEQGTYFVDGVISWTDKNGVTHQRHDRQSFQGYTPNAPPPTENPTATPAPTATPTATDTPTVPPTAIPTDTPTVPPNATKTPTPIVTPTPGKVNSQIKHASFKTTSSTTKPDVTYPAQSLKGVVVVTWKAQNNGTTLRNVSLRVTKLTHNNYLLNADGGPGQVGSKLSVPNSALPSGNQLWDKNEYLTQAFRIGLLSRSSFTIRVDVYAIKVKVAAAEAGTVDAPETEELVDSFFVDADPETLITSDYMIYLPVVSK